jgi:hypothetical protein
MHAKNHGRGGGPENPGLALSGTLVLDFPNLCWRMIIVAVDVE